MKYYLSELIPRLKKFSAKLDQTSFLVDKPWVVSSDQGAYEKLIFRRDGRVHLSSNGSVTNGKWEYLPEAQSLLIDYGDEKKLYNHQYLDEAVLALKQDGTPVEEDYFLLANENSIPDIDAEKYLRDKYLKENNVELLSLANGQELEVLKRYPNSQLIYSEVKLRNENLSNGKYLLDNSNERISIQNNKITNVTSKVNYHDGISVWQNTSSFPSKGEEVEGLEKGKFRVNDNSLFATYEIIVENGKVKKVKDLGLIRISFTIMFIMALIILSIYLARI